MLQIKTDLEQGFKIFVGTSLYDGSQITTHHVKQQTQILIIGHKLLGTACIPVVAAMVSAEILSERALDKN